MARLHFSLLRLNTRQIRAFLAGLAVIVIMGFFPPWVHEYRTEMGKKFPINAGYGPLTSPPVATSTYNLYATHVDVVTLLIQWIVAAGVTFGLLVYLADRNPETSRLSRRYER